MALTTQQRADYDTLPYTFKHYVYIDNPPIVFVGTFSEPPSDFTVTSFTVTSTVSGSLGAIKPGMTLELQDTSGNVYGSQRVRRVSGNIVYVGRSSVANAESALNYNAASRIVVYDEYRIWSKIPYIDSQGVQYKDNQKYVNANDAQPPVANATPVLFYLGDGSSHVFTLSASDSFPVRSGATITTYFWALADGIIQSGYNPSDETIEVSFPRGRRYVRVTVTDSNGISSSQVVLIVNVTEDDLFIASLSTVTKDVNKVSASIETLTPYITNVRLNAACIVATNDSILGSNVVLYGWLSEHSVEYDGDINAYRMSIEIDNAASRLEKIGAYPQTISTTDSAGTWFSVTDANIDIMTYYLYYWHSTLTEVCRFEWSGYGDDYALPQINSQGNSLLGQFDDLARSIGCRLTVSGDGFVKILPDKAINIASTQLSSAPILQDLTAITTLTTEDYGNANIDYNNNAKSSWLETTSIISSSSADDIEAVKFRSPSLTPLQGTSSQSITDWLVTSENEAKYRTANIFATRYENVIQSLSLELVKTRNIFVPSDIQIFKILFEDELKQKFKFNDNDCYQLLRTQERYDAATGVKTLTANFERVRLGVNAEKVPRIDNGSFNFPSVDFSPIEFTNIEFTGLEFGNNNPTLNIDGLIDNLLVVVTSGRIGVTTNATDVLTGSVTWSNYNHSATIGSGVRNFELDVLRPAVAGYIQTESKIFYAENLQSASPTFTDITPNVVIGANGYYSSITYDWRYTGVFAAVAGRNLGVSGNSFFVTTNRGSTWNEYTTSASKEVQITVHISAGEPDILYVGYDKLNFSYAVEKRTNKGATLVDTYIIPNISNIVPSIYAAVDAPNLFYAGGPLILFNTTTKTYTTVTDSRTRYPSKPYAGRFINVNPNNYNDVVMAPNDISGIKYFRNAGTLPTQVTLSNDTLGKIFGSYVYGVSLVNNGNGLYAYGYDINGDSILYAPIVDNAGTFVSLQGNLPAGHQICAIAGF